MVGCKMGDLEMVDLLIGFGADIAAKNPVGDTCMSLAQKSGNQDIVSLLVKKGVSIRPASA